jgi:hypothetical protein
MSAARIRLRDGQIFRYDIAGLASCGRDTTASAHAAYAAVRAQLEARFLTDVRSGRMGAANQVMYSQCTLYRASP